jgi:hypothetical protein
MLLQTTEHLDESFLIVRGLLNCSLNSVSGPVAGSCEHGDETWGSVKTVNYLEQLSRVLKKDSAAWS